MLSKLNLTLRLHSERVNQNLKTKNYHKSPQQRVLKERGSLVKVLTDLLLQFSIISNLLRLNLALLFKRILIVETISLKNIKKKFQEAPSQIPVHLIFPQTEIQRDSITLWIRINLLNF